MPKRVLDGEAMWASTKLSECPEWTIPEYSWLLPLADANGSFEITNFRVIWGKVAAIRPHLTLENLQEILRAFHQFGLLFTWAEGGKRYAHWVGSEKPGRLPQPARRTQRYGPILAPSVPVAELNDYLASVRQQKCRSATPTASLVLDLVLDRDREGVKPSSEAKGASDQESSQTPVNIQPSEAALGLAHLLQARIVENNPKTKVANGREHKWAVEADRMMRIDRRTADGIRDRIEWSQQDSFWKANILSMGALRKQFDRLTLKMQEEKERRTGKEVVNRAKERTRNNLRAAGFVA